MKIFWQVQNNETVIDPINKVNSRNKAISIFVFDFSNLYTNIPHHKLKSVMGELINFLIINKNVDFLYKTSLKLAIDYLLDNHYFTLGSLSFCQLIEIPMGSDLCYGKLIFILL